MRPPKVLFLPSLPSFATGGGESQVNEALLTSMATSRVGSTVCVFSSSSASNTPYRRLIALAASAIELKETAVNIKL